MGARTFAPPKAHTGIEDSHTVPELRVGMTPLSSPQEYSNPAKSITARTHKQEKVGIFPRASRI